MRTILLLLLTGSLYGSLYGQAQVPPESVAWNRAPEALAGHFVSMKLVDGTRIGGHWISVTPNTFTMKVRTSSNHRTVAENVQKIPRASIVEVRVGGRRNNRGRWYGTVLGIYGVTALAVRAQSAGLVIAAPLLGSFAGYEVGDAIDRRSRKIVLLPDDSQP